MAAKTKIKKMVRPVNGRKIAGVCVGIANYFNVDPTVIRLLWMKSNAMSIFTVQMELQT